MHFIIGLQELLQNKPYHFSLLTKIDWNSGKESVPFIQESQPIVSACSVNLPGLSIALCSSEVNMSSVLQNSPVAAVSFSKGSKYVAAYILNTI